MSLDVYLYKTCSCGETKKELFNKNITHNLGTMAEKAGIYKELWRPEELNIKKAKELINPLEKGLKKLTDNSSKYKEYNPDNGWGDYEGLVSFIEKYLEACKENKEAEIETSR